MLIINQWPGDDWLLASATCNFIFINKIVPFSLEKNYGGKSGHKSIQR